MYPIPGSSSSAHQAPVPANAYEYDVGILAQQSVYVPYCLKQVGHVLYEKVYFYLSAHGIKKV